jgi:hypothetical protein
VNALFETAVLDEQAHTGVAGDQRRAAALLLHGLGEADRRWAWSRLDATEQRALAPLMQELKELGVPSDAAWVRQVLASQAPSAPEAKTEDSVRDRIAQASPSQLVALLLPEPAMLVQRLLALGPWPWAQEVIGTLRAQRDEPFDPVSVGTLQAAPTLDEALLGHLAARLPTASSVEAPSHPTTWGRMAQAARRLWRGVGR